MLKLIRKFSLLFVLFATALACASPAAVPAGPNAAPLDPNSINTAIAGTAAAAATQTAQANPVINVKSPTPTLTKYPTMTPLPTFTPVVFVTLMRITKNTNCRSGPGKVYSVVGGFRAGEFAEVVGRSADSKYWIVRNPDRPDKVCWLAGDVANVTGVVGALKVMTPPPTPKPTRTNTPKPKPTRTPAPASSPTFTSTSPLPSGPPDFATAYDSLDSCPAMGWWVDMQLQNNGGVTFQSIAMVVEDTSTGTVLSFSSDDITDLSGCSQSNIWDTLPPGPVRLVSSPIFSYDPSGHNLIVDIALCSNTGLGGQCVTQTVGFVP